MKQYHDLIKDVLNNGVTKSDRTGTGIKSVFGYQMRFDLQKGLPLLTTKKIHVKAVIHELLWFLKGDTNISYLEEHNVKIWDAWALKEDVIVSDPDGYDQMACNWSIPKGEIGPMYGKQWTSWQNPDGTTTNQIEEAIELLKTNPNSRRIIVSAWNPSDLPDESVSPQENVANGKMALAACHAFFQFYVEPLSDSELISKYGHHIMYCREPTREERIADLKSQGYGRGKLSCQLYQRSADVFLGVPFNIASYAMLVHMIAQQCDLLPGEFIWTGGDTHIYSNHFEQVELQLTREPKPLPQLEFQRKPDSIFDYTFDDFKIINYDPDPLIKGTVSV